MANMNVIPSEVMDSMLEGLESHKVQSTDISAMSYEYLIKDTEFRHENYDIDVECMIDDNTKDIYLTVHRPSRTNRIKLSPDGSFNHTYEDDMECIRDIMDISIYSE